MIIAINDAPDGCPCLDVAFGNGVVCDVPVAHLTRLRQLRG